MFLRTVRTYFALVSGVLLNYRKVLKAGKKFDDPLAARKYLLQDTHCLETALYLRHAFFRHPFQMCCCLALVWSLPLPYCRSGPRRQFVVQSATGIVD